MFGIQNKLFFRQQFLFGTKRLDHPKTGHLNTGFIRKPDKVHIRFLNAISGPVFEWSTSLDCFLSILSYNIYSNHLNNGLVWYLNSRYVFGCQMVQYSNGGLKTGLKKPAMV